MFLRVHFSGLNGSAMNLLFELCPFAERVYMSLVPALQALAFFVLLVPSVLRCVDLFLRCCLLLLILRLPCGVSIIMCCVHVLCLVICILACLCFSYCVGHAVPFV